MEALLPPPAPQRCQAGHAVASPKTESNFILHTKPYQTLRPKPYPLNPQTRSQFVGNSVPASVIQKNDVSTWLPHGRRCAAGERQCRKTALEALVIQTSSSWCYEALTGSHTLAECRFQGFGDEQPRFKDKALSSCLCVVRYIATL